jgi:hypothetical protein
MGSVNMLTMCFADSAAADTIEDPQQACESLAR